MLSLLLLTAVQESASQPRSADSVVVVGKRLNEAYAACRRGACSARRDAEVSIALAEQYFRAGDYTAAKATLADAVARNRTRAESDPRAVGALYEAYATVSLHDGDLDRYRSATSARIQLLRNHLPGGDPAITTAEFEMAEVWTRLGKYSMADEALAAVERRERVAGRTRQAAIATLKRALIATASNEPAKASRLLADVDRVGADVELARAARIVRLRLAAKGADERAIDSMVDLVRSDASARPILLWAPPYQEDARAIARRGFTQFDGVDPVRSSGDFEPLRWADVGFWIRPDGRTGDIEILRGSRSRDWVQPLLQQVEGRRYTASAPSDGPGAYRIERFTWRPTRKTPIGKLVRIHAGIPALEVIDLTDPARH